MKRESVNERGRETDLLACMRVLTRSIGYTAVAPVAEAIALILKVWAATGGRKIRDGGEVLLLQ